MNENNAVTLFISSGAYYSSFPFSSSLSISKNLFIRFYDGQHQFTAVAAKLVVWLSLIGSFFFVYTGVHSAIRQLQDTESQSLSTKARMLMSNVMTLDQVIKLALKYAIMIFYASHSRPPSFQQYLGYCRILGARIDCICC
jgi:hypothetical protein